jgi:hypothetical protein
MSDLTLSDFRERFPEFDAEDYPDSAVNARLALAAKFFTEDIWTDEAVRLHAEGLYAAHFLKLHGSSAAGGNGGGSAEAPVSSKSVDGVSVSYDTSSASYSTGGMWNATAYGKELYALIRVFGAGARQI